jgi:hypothetical protein
VKEERPEIAEVVKLLSYSLELLSPIPEVGKKLAAHRRYLRRLSDRGGDLKFSRVIDICQALDLEPAELFRLAYRVTPRRTFAAQFLYQMWESHHPDEGPAPLRPPLPLRTPSRGTDPEDEG